MYNYFTDTHTTPIQLRNIDLTFNTLHVKMSAHAAQPSDEFKSASS